MGKTKASEKMLATAEPELEPRHADVRTSSPRVRAGAPRADGTGGNEQRSTRPPPATTKRVGVTQATVPHVDGTYVPPPAATLEIANAMVRAYKAALGRGPTKCRVHFAQADAVVVVLEDTMTAEERTLASLGEVERLREHRLVLTTALEDRFRSIVERALGRRTLAFVSGFDTRRDLAVELFTLEAEPTDDRTQRPRPACRPSPD